MPRRCPRRTELHPCHRTTRKGRVALFSQTSSFLRSVAQRARTRISDPASRYEDEYAQLLHQLARNAAARPTKGPTS